MINRDLARDLLTEFSGNPGYPDSVEGLAALISAFCEFCVHEPHARLVASELSIENDWAPTVAGIRRVANATRPGRVTEACANPDCVNGWVEVQVGSRTAQARCETCMPPVPARAAAGAASAHPGARAGVCRRLGQAGRGRRLMTLRWWMRAWSLALLHAAAVLSAGALLLSLASGWLGLISRGS